MENSSKFFCNKECQYFPCHETKDPDSFNCMFCYCPLYSYGDKCGGHFHYTKKGVKSCIDCTIPHHANSAEYINAKLKEFNASKPDQRDQLMVCLDMEGTIFPEIWEAVADTFGVPGLRRTTKDEPSYEKLMEYRIKTVNENGIDLPKIQKVIEGMEPFEGTVGFLEKIKTFGHVIIVSDTFEEFARPVEKKLGVSVICNRLLTDEEGHLVGYEMRTRETKASAVRGFQSMGYHVIAAGDGFNDIAMIRVADGGCLICPSDAVKEKAEGIDIVNSLDDLYQHICKEVENMGSKD